MNTENGGSVTAVNKTQDRQSAAWIKLRSLFSNVPVLIGKAVLLLWCVFTVVMFGWIFIASVSSTRDIFSGTLLASGVSFAGFENVIFRQRIFSYFFNSLLYSVIGCAGGLVIAAQGAYAFTKYRFRGRKILLVCLQVAMGLPSVMMLAPIFMGITQFSTFVKECTGFNLKETPLFIAGIYVMSVTVYTFFYMQGFLSTISNSFHESALVEGCTHVQAFWKVVFPLARPGVVTVTIFNFITLWNEYLWALVLLSNPKQRTIATAMQSIVRAFTNTGDYGGIFSTVIIVFVPTFIVFVSLSKVILGNIAEGGIKG